MSDIDAERRDSHQSQEGTDNGGLRGRVLGDFQLGSVEAGEDVHPVDVLFDRNGDDDGGLPAEEGAAAPASFSIHVDEPAPESGPAEEERPAAEERHEPEGRSEAEERIEAEAGQPQFAPVAISHDQIMRLEASLSQVRDRVERNAHAVRGEDAIKNGLVLPFILALGYDVFDPLEVAPAYVAEGAPKIDYGILSDDEARILIAVSSTPDNLETERARRLGEAMRASGARCAILTNGVAYRFHSDVDERGAMDAAPLLSLDLSTPDTAPAGLVALCRDTFDIDLFISSGAAARQEQAVRDAVEAELADPSDGFIDLILERIDPQLRPERTAAGDMLRRFRIPAPAHVAAIAAIAPSHQSSLPPAISPGAGDDREMSEIETAAFQIVRDICARHVAGRRVYARPAKSYCAVLLDDSNRKTIVRLHFNALRAKYVGTFVERDETRHPIADIAEISGLEEKIIERLRELDPQAFG